MHKPQWIYNKTNGDSEGGRPGGRGLSTHILPEFTPGDPLPAKAKMIGHTGSAYGLNSAFYFDPKGKYGFVSRMNGSVEEPKKKPSAIFYDFEVALLKALRDQSALPCK
jgi:CubicO group peptidase (beta-lactamase class C family)